MEKIDEKRKGEIARVVLERFLAKEFRFSDVANFRGEIGNIAEETGIPQDELSEFIGLILRKKLKEHLAVLRPREKVG